MLHLITAKVILTHHMSRVAIILSAEYIIQKLKCFHYLSKIKYEALKALIYKCVCFLTISFSASGYSDSVLEREGGVGRKVGSYAK